MWPLFATTADYAMNTIASEALNDFSPFKDRYNSSCI